VIPRSRHGQAQATQAEEGGWLFTIGFAQLGFWKAVLALVIWPYFLGTLAR
jgi:hypothetical protein